jgi:transposase
VWFTDSDGFRVVYQGWETPLYRVALDDEVELRYVAVSLRQGGLVRQEEIARAFGHSVESQRRWERRYETEGLAGLRRKKASGAPWKITGTEEAYIRKWFDTGETKSEMARRLGVNEGTVRNALKRMGLHRSEGATEALPFVGPEAGTEETPATETVASGEERADVEACGDDSPAARPPSLTFADPLDRSLDRLLARLGKLDDAAPVFADVEGLPHVGVLLAIPLLVESGVLEIFARIYRSIGPAFYGLRTSVVCLFVLSLLRIKRPENLKEHSPEDLGRLLGLDRAPEVKTLRRKLDALAERGRGLELMRALGEKRVQDHEEAIGVLYVDGHVKEYHGKAKVGKAYITCRRLSAPASTDTWVNDENGDPVFMVSSELNAGLTQTLEPVLSEVREFVGEEKRITVVFDRGGWSPKLFYRLITSGFDIITYRKGHRPTIPVHAFEVRELTDGDDTYEYRFHDQARVRVGQAGALRPKGNNGKKPPKYVWMRQVTRLSEDQHQIPVITSRKDLPAEKVLHLISRRWRQENFFKYMLEEFALDALVEYGADPVVEGDRPNPEVTKIGKELRRVRTKLAQIERLIGVELSANEESKRPSVRGFKIAHADLLREAGEAKNTIAQLEARRAKLPKRVPASDLDSLKKDRKVITDAVKMVAYQIESELARMLAGDYARCDDEGRTLLHAAFQSRGDLEVNHGEIRVTLAPQSSPHRTQAISKLCEKLTKIGVTFPGTDLRLALAVAEPVKIA